MNINTVTGYIFILTEEIFYFRLYIFGSYNYATLRWKEYIFIFVPIISPILTISVPTISAITHVLQLMPTLPLKLVHMDPLCAT